jgi:hypothetical protein
LYNIVQQIIKIIKSNPNIAKLFSNKDLNNKNIIKKIELFTIIFFLLKKYFLTKAKYKIMFKIFIIINKIKINAKIPPLNKLYKKILEIFSVIRILSACGP